MMLYKNNIFKYIAFSSMAVLMIAMMCATLIERFRDSSTAFSTVYHAPWFIGLWGVGSLCALIHLVQIKMHRRIAAMGIHLAFALILIGALLSHLTGKSGTLHLRVGEEALHQFDTNSGKSLEMPFGISLRQFNVVYHRGTTAPMDYTATVEIVANGSSTIHNISMNKILKHSNIRLYMSNYDEDEQGVNLVVNSDPLGIAVTYSGYLALLIALVALFFDHNSLFRKALRRITTPAATTAALLLIAIMPASGASPTPKAFPRDVAATLGQLHVLHHNRIAPLQTLARDYTLKLYGRTSVCGYTPEQVLSGLLFYRDTWTNVPLKQRRGKASTPQANEAQLLFNAIARADILRILPYASPTGQVQWFAPTDRLPAEMPAEQWLFFKRVLDVIAEDAYLGQFDSIQHTLNQIIRYQHKTAAATLPAPRRISAERAYNRIGHPKALSMGCTSIGLLLFVAYIALSARKRALPKRPRQAFALLLAGIGLYIGTIWGLRWVASGHIPMTNGFEVMLFMALMSSILGFAIQRRIAEMLPFGYVLTGLTLLVAVLGESNPQITPLMPVLASPLLSIHVACVMCAYTLLGMLALNGLLGLCVAQNHAREHLANLGMVMLYPALFLLIVGIFVGAVWANISWGNYWSWDPKETWALITMMLYAAPLHQQSIAALRKPRNFHLFSVAAFSAVLITYFGVNMLLGGMHSYAQ
ncbi:MAG: cytochrome c biogenesis protein CcsA [Bacteroidales bacterium]|nr:cytochrome c biogenesis protein CcsA [Bacteroidales bacterium]